MIPRTTLPGAGLEVTRLCLGTMTFGDQTDAAQADRMIATCLDAGVDFIDTANVYNDGASEEMLGKLLERRRDRVLLATKACGRVSRPEPHQGLGREALRKAVEASLQRLRTDRVDILYLHQPDYETPIAETLETLDDLRREGKIRFPAASNYASWQMAEMREIAERNGWTYPNISQVMYNVLARNVEQEHIPFARRRGVGLVAYNPLAGGLLTGKHSWESGPLAGTRFDGNRRYLDRYWREPFFRAAERLRAAAEERGRTLIEVAFQWLLSRDAVHSIIVGASRPEQLDANLKAAAAPPLEADLLQVCDEVWEQLKGPVPAYNR